MAFKVLLYSSLLVFTVGLIYRIWTWFYRSTEMPDENIPPFTRFLTFIKGFAGIICSLKLFTLIKTLILDLILQRRTLKESVVRWIMHMLIYSGFILLILMHAFGDMITASFFSDYYSTLNPFFFLRDLFGLMVMTGVFIALLRRFVIKHPRLKSNGMDLYAIIIVGIIILSGIFLEGVKITSYSDFTRMVEDYAGLDMEDDVEEVMPLESLWVKDFGLVSPNVTDPFEEDILELGFENHEMNCMSCHSSPKWAFTGYITAKAISPAALFLDRAKISTILYYIHILSCFIGLALLPFTKMLHIISTPISLLANSVMDKESSIPANIATRQAMEIDACVHCGTCSQFCSAMMGYEAKENPYILPSEKMVLLKNFTQLDDTGQEVFRAMQEGIYLCTNCDRCTVVCPSGINLKDLWISVREDLIQRGLPEPLMISPLSLVRGLNRKAFQDDGYPLPLKRARETLAGRFDSLNDPGQSISLPLTDEADNPDLKIPDGTFSYCFSCQNCTTVCPVVDNYENPQESLGLLPHQIMRCLGLGLKEMASGPDMLWDCVTCYQCQEHCPQKVKVTDILYELKNMAVEKLENKEATNNLETKV